MRILYIIIVFITMPSWIAHAASYRCQGHFLSAYFVDLAGKVDMSEHLNRLNVYLSNHKAELIHRIALVYDHGVRPPDPLVLKSADAYQAAKIQGDTERIARTRELLNKAMAIDPFFEQWGAEYPRRAVENRFVEQLDHTQPESLPPGLAILYVLPGASEPAVRVGSVADRISQARLMYARVVAVREMIDQLKGAKADSNLVSAPSNP